MKKNYVDNKKFYEAIVEYKKKCREAESLGKEKPRIPEYIGECIYKIADHLSYHPWFINYSYKQDLVGEAVKNCIEYFDNFDETKYKNPFAYFTQIVYFAFRRCTEKEERNRYIIYKNFEVSMVQNGNLDLLDDENDLQANSMYDNISEFIERFEKKEKERKEKHKKSKTKDLELVDDGEIDRLHLDKD